jgi:hypothetical protein
MATTDETQRIETETKRLLHEVLDEAVQQLPLATSLEGSQRRRWFSIGLLLLAPFCIAVAALFWVQSDPATSTIWISFSLVLLLVGGWQFDKANKDTGAAHSNTSNHVAGSTRKSQLRRIQ